MKPLGVQKINLPKEEVSYWQSSAKAVSYPELTRNISVDVAIAGGGITGLSCAYLLKKSGLKVAVIEKNTIGSGTTSKTTGKITSQHDLIYKELTQRLGEKAAKTYGAANQEALKNILRLINEEKIDCELEIADNYVFTTDPDKVNQYKSEAVMAAKLGLPASFETKLDLPFKVKGAVKFTGQAKFNVQKYVDGLARLVNGQGSYVFENSNVTGFHDGEPAAVKTNRAIVTAANIIVATKIPAAPLLARGAYALLEHPHTSYIVAGEPNYKLNGMYISPDKDHYSILPVKHGEKNLLLIGGQHHTPGLGNPKHRYQKLADYGEKYFGFSAIDYTWKGMDYIAYDNVPLVGKVYPWSDHLYTATGFKKWGLSTSMVAGIILCDLINGVINPWLTVFNSSRLKPITSIPHEIARSFKS